MIWEIDLVLKIVLEIIFCLKGKIFLEVVCMEESTPRRSPLGLPLEKRSQL